MSTKSTNTSNQTTTNSYNPAGMSAYNALIPQFQQYISGILGTSPQSSALYKTLLGAGNRSLNQGAATSMYNLGQNALTAGYGGSRSSPQNLAQIAQAGRYFSGQRAGLQQNSLLSAIQQQMQAAGMAGGFQPLQTGGNTSGTSTQTTGGLGSWLPQLIGGLGGAALGGLTGGLSTGLGSLGSLFQASGVTPTSLGATTPSTINPGPLVPPPAGGYN